MKVKLIFLSIIFGEISALPVLNYGRFPFQPNGLNHHVPYNPEFPIVPPNPYQNRVFWNSLGDIIHALPFLPITVNVPDTVSGVYNGASYVFSHLPIINRWFNPNEPRPLKFFLVIPPPGPVYNPSPPNFDMDQPVQVSDSVTIDNPWIQNILKGNTVKFIPEKIGNSSTVNDTETKPNLVLDKQSEMNLIRYIYNLQKHNELLQQANVLPYQGLEAPLNYNLQPPLIEEQPQVSNMGAFRFPIPIRNQMPVRGGGYGLFYPEEFQKSLDSKEK